MWAQCRMIQQKFKENETKKLTVNVASEWKKHDQDVKVWYSYMHLKSGELTIRKLIELCRKGG